MSKFLIIFSFICVSFSGVAQTISGYVMGRDNNPIPFANIYFKGTTQGTTTNSDGYYYHEFRSSGQYDLVFTAIGYKSLELEFSFKVSEEISRNVYLDVDIEAIDEVIVKAKRKDPAYGIIQSAIENKERWNTQLDGYSCKVYIKATEVISEREKRRRERLREERKIQKQNEDREDEDIFEKEKRDQERKIQEIAGGMNMVEAQIIRHFQVPDQVKEIREGYKKLGDTFGLYYTTTAEDDFNFYDNLMDLESLNEVPLVSPLHVTSVLTYKFELLKTDFIEGAEVYEIKVTPRKKGNAGWRGRIWIQNDLFCIRKIDLHLNSDAMIVFNEFNIKQDYSFENDSVIVVSRQEFNYKSKAGKQRFQGRTLLNYSDYELNPVFDKKFFGNEVAITSQEAYDKDSLYWKSTRPEPLTVKEQRYQFVKDSLYTVTHSEEYLDSLDRVQNKIGLVEVFWEGIFHSNRTKKQYWGLYPMIATYFPLAPGGGRILQGGQYFKIWDNKTFISAEANLSYGLRNDDLKGAGTVKYRYDPMHLGEVEIGGARQFMLVATNDALTNLFQRKNWLEEKTGFIEWQRELFNGLMIRPHFRFIDRSSIADYKFNPDADDFFEDNNPRDFDPYQVSLFRLRVSYTPFQKYMTEPHRKVILGSKWPTFSILYKKGIPKLFGADADFDFLSADINQSFKLGTLGTSTYKLESGKFLSTRKLFYEDSKIFPRGDKWFFATAMKSMQLQDTTLISSNLYAKAHFIHHFNGAIVNYIPLVKKLGIHFTVGGGSLWIKDLNYQYAEMFAGVERSFRISRFRYRFGVYYVQAVSNYSTSFPGIKFAVNRYNVRDKGWE